ncbi:MAG: hypothetical protein ACRETX_12730, partial [Steroidobacteraceae bacterium]
GYGARGDGRTLDTAAIQRAIDACAARGGGMVLPHAPMFGPLPAHGLYVRHAEGLTLRNVRLRVAGRDARPAGVFDDVVDLQLDGVRPAAGSPASLWLNDVVGALIHSSRPVGASDGVVSVTGARSRDIRVTGNRLEVALGDGAPRSAVRGIEH